MKISRHPFRYNYKILYPKLEIIKRFEGGIINKSNKAGKWYLIIDEGTMADFLDEEDLDELVKIIEFESEIEFNQYLKKHYELSHR